MAPIEKRWSMADHDPPNPHAIKNKLSKSPPPLGAYGILKWPLQLNTHEIKIITILKFTASTIVSFLKVVNMDLRRLILNFKDICRH